MRFSVIACLSVIASSSVVAQNLTDDPLLQEPTTPAGHLEAAQLMIGLERPDLAREHFRKLLAANPTTSEVKQLTSEFGLTAFLQMARDRSLRPESRELLKLVNEAAVAVPSPAELDAYVADLNSGGAAAVNAALALERFGARSVPALIATTDASAERLLKSQARVFQDGLTEMLPDADEPERIRILTALSVTARREVVDFVLRDAFAPDASQQVRSAAQLAINRLTRGNTRLTTPDAAANHLLRRSRQLLTLADEQARMAGTGDLTADTMMDDTFANLETLTNSGTTEVAEWVADSNTITVNRIPRYEATLRLAKRLTDDALAIRPGHPETLAVAGAISLAQDLSPLAWDAMAAPLADTIGTDLTAVADAALLSANAAASFGALKLLEGDTDAIIREHVLRRGMTDRDARVRLQSALQATSMTTNDPSLASRAVDVLHAMARMTDAPLAVVIDQNRSRGGRMGVFMADLGYHCVPTPTGIAGFDLATDAGDCSAVLVNAGCIRWSLSPTIANLKKAPQTSSIPIIIYGEEFQRGSVESLAARYDHVTFVPESFTAEAFAARIHNLDLAAPRLTAEERNAMRQVAATRLEELSGTTEPGAE